MEEELATSRKGHEDDTYTKPAAKMPNDQDNNPTLATDYAQNGNQNIYAPQVETPINPPPPSAPPITMPIVGLSPPAGPPAIYGKKKGHALVIADLVLRSCASLVLLIAVPIVATVHATAFYDNTYSFQSLAALKYIFSASLIGFLYSLFQAGAALFRLITDGTLLPLQLTVYSQFIGDQIMVYLLLSAGSSGAAAIQIEQQLCDVYSTTYCEQSSGSISMVFIGFVVLVGSFMFSTYNLSKYLFSK